ncbi:MAG: hypothetical protein ACJA2C_002015, partial [Marinoscillum sp.]
MNRLKSPFLTLINCHFDVLYEALVFGYFDIIKNQC